MNERNDTESKLQALELELSAARLAAAKSEQDVRDMTDKLQQVNEQIAKLNRDNQASIEKIRDYQYELEKSAKLTELGQLTATIAHEIRNPLGSIRTSSFVLERQLKDGPENALKPLARIKKGVDRCDVIITELLDFARTKALDLVPVNLDDWIQQTIQEHKGEAIQAVVVETDLGLRGAEVTFDPSRMDRALVNMMSNAVEAMVGKGGHDIENPTMNPKIIIATKRTDRGIEISVTDNGPGIKDEDLQKIFDPLFTTKSFGVGLGLSAVKKIFEQHGGSLEVSTAPGQGATFTGWIGDKGTMIAAA